MRQRRFPDTAGDWQGVPLRVLAPQRGLDRMGPILRGCIFVIEKHLLLCQEEMDATGQLLRSDLCIV